MILSCPSCNTRYLVDPTALGSAGRVVRCAKCRHEWHERPPPAPAELSPSSGLEPAPSLTPRGEPGAPASDPPKLPAIAEPRRNLGAIGWAGLAACIVAIVAAGIVFRARIMEQWPQAASAYSAVGLAAPAAIGLDFQNLRYERAIEGDQKVLIVSGEVVNHSTATRTIPPIRVALRDASERELVTQTSAAGEANLAPGAISAFDLRMPNPPDEAVQVAVTFAKAP